MAQRIRQLPDSEPNEPRLDPQPPSLIVAEAGSERIGRLLRRTREGYGQDLVSVAAQLRIRATYLDAIEKGRFADLPGPTYALGFVRSYAEYLGLDGADLVRRFREEAAGLQEQTQLAFPTMAAEGRVPRGAILLLSAALALFAYGGWYYLSNREPSVAELVPQVPDRLAGEIAPAEAPPAPAVDPAAAVPTAALPEDGGPSPAEPASVSPAAVDSVIADTVPPLEEPAGETALPDPTVPTDFAAGSPAEVVEAPPSEIAPADLAEVEPPAPSEAAAREVTAAAPPPAAAAATIPAVPAEAASESMEQAFGATNLDSRVVLRARLESWVQVSDAGNAPLFTRVLRAGDSYQVPNQPGLTLATGNAGGLEISVDGVAAPPLGPVGVVRRGLSLDPERLRTGTAAPTP